MATVGSALRPQPHFIGTRSPTLVGWALYRHVAGHFLEARFGTADPDCWWYGFANTGWGYRG
jgi:hypothetical protein